MTSIRAMIRQEAAFTAKIFFAPIYGTYLAIKEAVAERESHEAKDSVPSVITGTTPVLVTLMSDKTARSSLVYFSTFHQKKWPATPVVVNDIDPIIKGAHPAFKPKQTENGLRWHEA